MAINTYVELDKVTVSGSSTTYIEFLNIPQTYTDLVVKVSARSTNGTILSLDTRFNGDTSNAYSRTYYFTSGSGGFSAPEANTPAYQWAYPQGTDTPTGTFCSDTLYLNNYTSSINPKPLLSRSNQSGSINMISGQWRSSSAITSIRMALASGTLVAGSTISLYGIKAWANTEASPKAAGGYVYSDTNYWYHAFPFSSTFTPTQSITADVLLVAGGGGGGNGNGGGGGGAGGVLNVASQSLTATGYTVTVGSGGAMSTDGTSSSFASSIALKGARGADASANGIGGSGTYGSGGGLGRDGGQFGGGGTAGQGFRGGNSGYPSTNGGSGGGGAGGVGGDVVNADPENFASPNGDGGIGTNTYSSWLAATKTGVAGYIAGGGGGSSYQGARNAEGGLGGGGRGCMANSGAIPALSGLPNTGGGGGGGGTGAFNSSGMPGGSGLVIVRYAK